MKKVGLVGGIGPESTISYYHDIVYGVQKEVGRDFFPDVSIESIALFKWVDLCDKKEYDKLADYTMEPIERLARSGADFAVLTANTAHLIFDQVQSRSPIPLISIVEAAAEEAARRGYAKVGLLGTGFTMKNDFFNPPFQKRGIEVAIPGEEDMAFIHKRSMKSWSTRKSSRQPGIACCAFRNRWQKSKESRGWRWAAQSSPPFSIPTSPLSPVWIQRRFTWLPSSGRS